MSLDFITRVDPSIGGIFIDVTRPAYGAVGDGVADDTAAIQAALDLFAYDGPYTGGHIFIPRGTYNHTGLIYRGDFGHSVIVEGENTGGGLNGVILKYTGTSAGTGFQILGANDSVFRDFSINGNSGLAKVGFLVDYDYSRSQASFNCVFERLIVGGVAGTDSVCFKVGTGAFASAEHTFQDCRAVGHSTPGTTHFGIKVFGSNCKNIRWLRGGFMWLKWGFDSGNSGYFLAEAASFAGQTEADIYPFGNEVTMIACGSEGSKRLIGGASGGGPTVDGGITLLNCYWHGAAPSDDYISSFAGRMYLVGNRFGNSRTGSSLPKFQTALDGGILGPSFVSINNCYEENTPSGIIPVYNSSGNPVSINLNGPLRLVSLNDFSSNVSGGAPSYNFPSIISDLNGHSNITVVTASGAYSISQTDTTIQMDATGGGNYGVLPDAADAGINKRYLLMKMDASANLCQFYSPSSAIRGSTDGTDRVDLANQYDFAEIVSNGSEYLVIRRNVAAGGAGTVTIVSVVTANGVSGSVATDTTTPAITLALGAITPSSINVSGVLKMGVTGSAHGIANSDDGLYFNSDSDNNGSDGSMHFGTNRTGTSGGTEFLSMSDAGVIRIFNCGSGTATFDASGNITSVSDERLKINRGKFMPGLEAIQSLEPILYSWREESGMETEHVYPGFFAQNVMKVIPEAVMLGENGFYGLTDRGIIAALVNSIKELNHRIEEIEKK